MNIKKEEERALSRRQTRIMKAVNNAVEIEKQGGDVLFYIEHCGLWNGDPAGLVWREWQTKYLKRARHELTDGLPKRGMAGKRAREVNRP